MSKGHISIAGAGPAGLSCAICLAKHGYDVDVYEKNNDVGGRFNESFQCFENFSDNEDFIKKFKQMGFVINFELSEHNNLNVLNSSDEVHVMKSSKPIWYMLRRGNNKGAFDYGLKEQALKVGVNIFFNTPAPRSVLVDATGGKKPVGISREIVFESDVEEAMYFTFNNKLSYKGYSYLFIHKYHGTICTAVVGKFDKIDHYMDQTLNYFKGKLDFSMNNVHSQTNYVSLGLPDTAIDKGTLLLGERAGFQDGMFGFGLKYAISSGYYAAQSIINNTSYDVLWKEGFRNKLVAGVANRVLFETFGSISHDKMIKDSANNDFRNYLTSMYGSSFIKKVLAKFSKYK